jgi:hypothetical protein
MVPSADVRETLQVAGGVAVLGGLLLAGGGAVLGGAGEVQLDDSVSLEPVGG